MTIKTKYNIGDAECFLFWQYYDGIVGKGATPEEAFNDLRKKMSDDNPN